MSAPETRKRVRCAIYTRKSSEEGLEQEFNSLDAQREACEAYTSSSATGFTSAKPYTREPAIQESIRPSSVRNSGTRSMPS